MSKVIGIEYTLVDTQSGNKLDSNAGQAPLEFISGKGQIIPGLEEKIISMNDEESQTIVVEPKMAYGEYDENAIEVLPKEQFAGIELTEGMTLYGSGEQGKTVQVVVKSFDDKEVTIDYNHPLAGKSLTFDVKIISSREATAEEDETGVVGGKAAMGASCSGCSGHGHDDESCCESENGTCDCEK